MASVVVLPSIDDKVRKSHPAPDKIISRRRFGGKTGLLQPHGDGALQQCRRTRSGLTRRLGMDPTSALCLKEEASRCSSSRSPYHRPITWRAYGPDALRMTAYVFDRGQHRRNRYSASSLRSQGQHAKAYGLLRQNLAMSSKTLGEHDLTVLSDQDSLSDCLRELGDYEGAIILDEVTLPIRQRLDKEGEDTIATLQSLADNLSQTGKHQKALPLHRSALATRTKTLGMYHEDTLQTKHNLASSLYELGHAHEASELNAQILRARQERLAADDDDLIATRHNLATNHYALGNLEQAAKLTNQNLLTLQKTRTSDDPQLLAIYGLQDRLNAAIREARRAQGIDLRQQERSTTKREPGLVSGDHGKIGPQASVSQSDLHSKNSKPQRKESVAWAEADIFEGERAATARAYIKECRDQNSMVDLSIRADTVKRNRNQQAGVSNPQPDRWAQCENRDANAGAAFAARYDNKRAMNAMAEAKPSQRVFTEAVKGLKSGTNPGAKEVNSKFENPKTGSYLGIGPMGGVAEGFIVETVSRATNALQPEVEVACAKKSSTGAGSRGAAAGGTLAYPGVPKQSSSCLQAPEKMAKNAQQSHYANGPHRRPSSSEPNFEVVLREHYTRHLKRNRAWVCGTKRTGSRGSQDG